MIGLLQCGCETIVQRGYFKINGDDSRLVSVLEEEYESMKPSEGLLINVCPRCGHLSGISGTSVTKLFTAPGAMIPQYFHEKRLMFAASGVSQERLSNA